MSERPNILRRSFVYRNSAETDIRKTFARIRKAMKEAAQKPVKVVQIKERKP